MKHICQLSISILLVALSAQHAFCQVNNLNQGSSFATIQAAIDAAAVGDTIEVEAGTYPGNIIIDVDQLTLRSESGRAVTILDGVNANTGTLTILSGTNGVTIGSQGKGFTILGINGNGAIESAAVLLAGSHTDITVAYNDIVARGDHGLLSLYNAAIDNIVIHSNVFSGKTFEGNEPSGCGFSTQFDVGNNVPRQMVVLGGGANVTNSMNVTFTNNIIRGTAGAYNSEPACVSGGQGNSLVTIDVIGAEISNNTFAGITTGSAYSLRARGSASSIRCNRFFNSGLGPNCGHIFLGSANPLSGANPATLEGIAEENAFVEGGSYLTPIIPQSYVVFQSLAQGQAAAAFFGIGQSAVETTFSLDLALGCPPEPIIEGCIDPLACNFLPDAIDDDGSCLLADCLGVCGGDAYIDEFGECVQGQVSEEGCIDPLACNFDPEALIDDGSCDYSCYGCTDCAACNFDPLATLDDGLCHYDCIGCTYAGADNYDPLATQDNGNCEFSGCTDPNACNYHPVFTLNDGSCDYTCNCPEDVNGDGEINAADLLDVLAVYGQDCDDL